MDTGRIPFCRATTGMPMTFFLKKEVIVDYINYETDMQRQVETSRRQSDTQLRKGQE